MNKALLRIELEQKCREKGNICGMSDANIYHEMKVQFTKKEIKNEIKRWDKVFDHKAWTSPNFKMA